MAVDGLAARAVKRAGEVRRRCGVAPDAPLWPFGAAESLNISVRVVDLPTLEGVYLRDQATIVVGTRRPFGRRRYSCAHEIGHHVFGHGTRIHRSDMTLVGRRAGRTARWAEEFLANRFA